MSADGQGRKNGGGKRATDPSVSQQPGCGVSDRHFTFVCGLQSPGLLAAFLFRLQLEQAWF
jgi:hypothetical protein